jgi:hypothetical protein
MPLGRVGLAMAVGVVGLVATAVPAWAGKITAAGTMTCSYGTTLTFSPPLEPGIGTPVPRSGSEVITLAPAAIGSCTGSLTAGSLPTSGTNTKPLIFKIKPINLNHSYFAGGCIFFNSVQLLIKHTSIDWINSSGVLKPTKVAPGIASLGSDPSGNLGFPFSGSATGSFAGAAAMNLFFDAASTSALQGCLGGSGSVAALTIDPTQSSISFG